MTCVHDVRQAKHHRVPSVEVHSIEHGARRTCCEGHVEGTSPSCRWRLNLEMSAPCPGSGFEVFFVYLNWFEVIRAMFIFGEFEQTFVCEALSDGHR